MPDSGREGKKMKIPTSIENILNENIVENTRLELKKNWGMCILLC